MKNFINWHEKIKEKPIKNKRILVFSPIFSNHETQFRIIDSQFLHLCREVTHWVYLTSPIKDKK